ncbi:peptide chain release factor N(5)-glutamine methyltransferase [Lacibacterium aquatile]|uniref:Release factor glutamine methyltransferase n=1 Tax=Lacibacterium aquatile TaxID=1168082 RepID=A0ABW5DWI7_9PROT
MSTEADALLVSATQRLAAVGNDTARLDARLLLAAACGVEPADLTLGRVQTLQPAQRARFARMIARRERNEPVGRILGYREFWSLNFRLGPDTLEPRPDSEALVEACLARLPERTAPYRMVDLGTGTGCLLLSILSERPQTKGVGVDIAPGALRVARRNAVDLGLKPRARFQLGNWLTGIGATFDLILSNPPYIPSADVLALAPEVKDFDPARALDGGPDGLGPYRILAAQAPARLKKGGWLAVEIGWDQGPRVADLFKSAGLTEVAVLPDLGGRDRVVVGLKAQA